MNSRWFIVSPVQNSWSGLAVLSMCVRGMRAITNSNGDDASPWKIPTFIGTASSVSAPHVSSILQDFIVFPKNLTMFLLFPLCLSFLSPWSEGSCHKFSDSWSIPVLSSSSFVLLPEEASYLCLTYPQHPLNFSCILSVFPVISLCSLENHRFHQQFSLSTVFMSSGDM